MERLQSYEERDQTARGSIPLLSTPKRGYEVIGIGLLATLPLPSPFDREILIYTVLKDQIFLQHPDMNAAKKQELFESC